MHITTYLPDFSPLSMRVILCVEKLCILHPSLCVGDVHVQHVAMTLLLLLCHYHRNWMREVKRTIWIETPKSASVNICCCMMWEHAALGETPP